MSGHEATKPPDTLVICSPYRMPDQHWHFDRETGSYTKKSGRRGAGFRKATKDSRKFDDPGIYQPIPYVDEIRGEVDGWRRRGYPGCTGTTARLLRYWRDGDVGRRHEFFFCQLEAIETIIWATEIGPNHPAIRKLGSDGKSKFKRLCSKMATGTGKTTVMAMLVAWQVLNKLVNNADPRFTKNILVVAPTIAVKRRLQVLDPKKEDNYYKKFSIVDGQMLKSLKRAKMQITNWHLLMTSADFKPEGRVDRRPRENTDQEFARLVLGHDYGNILVINDEAHHAWRYTEEDRRKGTKEQKDEIDKATEWMRGLDRIHGVRGITRCHDFSATPFIPSGHSSDMKDLFPWIISDFSLDDAVESGLVKTPRMPKHDDGGGYGRHAKSEFYHIFDSVGKALQDRRAKDDDKLPPLIVDAYEILASDWRATHREWSKKDHKVPPAMITVCNTTKSARRIHSHFVREAGDFGLLAEEERMEIIDFKRLKELENGAKDLLDKIDTVGKEGGRGQDVTNVISVNMLSEGWDAHNVTHIMGLRAFGSQLLCEQVVGRGLRRKSYDVDPETGLLTPEHVIIFGIPFSFMPMEGNTGNASPPKPMYEVYPVPEKRLHEIAWPVGHVVSEPVDRLNIRWEGLDTVEIDGTHTRSEATVADAIDGQPIGKENTIRAETRLQNVIFRVARDVYAEIDENWARNGYAMMVCLVRAVEMFIGEGKVVVHGVDYHGERSRYNLVLKRNMHRIVRHIADGIKHDTRTRKVFVCDDPSAPIRSTGDMDRWFASRGHIKGISKSHLSIGVYDSGLERAVMGELEHSRHVESWVKNDGGVGFAIPYSYKGDDHMYVPDFIIRLENGTMLVLETKGVVGLEAEAKEAALAEWVEAVNKDGGYGIWASGGMVHDRAVARAVIDRHARNIEGARVEARCPRCRARAEGHAGVLKTFGFRTVGGITRPQSWCHKCRGSV
ncbi:MAG: DEAD/DEAH box helicase family protein [Hyphomicrobiaceae bacterium]|nr:DEAD/DEAH box helicase family protein [Hyphomicrobiaceae bacterium]